MCCCFRLWGHIQWGVGWMVRQKVCRSFCGWMWAMQIRWRMTSFWERESNEWRWLLRTNKNICMCAIMLANNGSTCCRWLLSDVLTCLLAVGASHAATMAARRLVTPQHWAVKGSMLKLTPPNPCTSSFSWRTRRCFSLHEIHKICQIPSKKKWFRCVYQYGVTML